MRISPTPLVAVLLAACAVAAILLPPGLLVLVALVVVVASFGDALLARRRPPALVVGAPGIAPRGAAVPVTVTPETPEPRLRLRLVGTPGVVVQDGDARGRLAASVTAGRRGRHVLPLPVARRTGPLALGRWDHRGTTPVELRVLPDYRTAHALAAAVRSGRSSSGLRNRGPYGLGTEFDHVREYAPEDDVRQVNWRATERMGRPMSNQRRVEADRDVVVLVDVGRLGAAPADRDPDAPGAPGAAPLDFGGPAWARLVRGRGDGGRGGEGAEGLGAGARRAGGHGAGARGTGDPTPRGDGSQGGSGTGDRGAGGRGPGEPGGDGGGNGRRSVTPAEVRLLDVWLDAAAAVAATADVLDDHVGAIAYDDRIRRQLQPRRGAGDAVVRALHDLEPTRVDSDHERAFRAVGGTRRAFVLVLTDLLDEAAAGPLLAAAPLLARRHALCVATIEEPRLRRLATAAPEDELGALAQAVAVDVRDQRDRVAARLRARGAQVLTVPPGALPAAAVQAYVRAKRRGVL